MPDKSKKFHEFSLKSILFKGRNDWYFCYLKTERIAHVLAVLASRSDPAPLKDMLRTAQSLPGEIARMAAGEFDVPVALAEVFALLSALRLAGTQGLLHPENVSVLLKEYEVVAEKLVAGSHPSPFISSEDFLVQELQAEPLPLPSRLHDTQGREAIKDSIKDTSKQTSNKGQSPRVAVILDYIRTHKGASIKEISSIIKDCSEKTVQRELNELITQGLVRRVGERRWSTYELA